MCPPTGVKSSSRERGKRHKVVAKVHERIKNKRSNFTHQQSRKLVDRYGFIAVEDLSVKRMNKNHCLAKAIADAAWTDLTNKLTYKAEWAGRVLVKPTTPPTPLRSARVAVTVK